MLAWHNGYVTRSLCHATPSSAHLNDLQIQYEYFSNALDRDSTQYRTLTLKR